MAAATQGSGHFTSSRKLEDQAASAALSSTTGTESRLSSHPLFDEDGKLSSASAATSLKYARPQDLPSFPSAGLQMSAAGAAASIAETNKKSFQHWKPDKIPTANMAALAARDYEMNPLWQHEVSAAGSKAAAMAHRDTLNKKAASKDNDAVPARASTAASPDVQKKALLAAHSALSSTRRRSGSAPAEPAPAPSKDTSWALKAANKSHQDGIHGGAFTSGDPGFEAARIQNIAKNNVNRQLYGSAPPVSIEVQEKNRQDTLRASAVAMAQKMYAVQQQNLDASTDGIRSDSRMAASRVRSHTATGSSSSMSDDYTSSRYENLEEAARRLAQERLAKIHDEHAEYRNYYGQKSPQRSRLSMRLRRRASSAADADDSDEEQSRKIRNQMSLFTSKLAEVDSKKRQSDRDALLQLAHRNVDAQMQKMDDRVFQDTGKASPAQMEKWEKAAREKAQAESDERMKNVGKVHIGAGKYLDQSEVDAIAKARLQPTLDDITDKAEKQRARDEEERLERERLAEQQARDKAREAEIAAQTKAANDKEKAEERARLDEEKRVQREQATAEKEQKRAELAVEKERKKAEAATEKERKQTEAAAEKERKQTEAAAEKERRQAEAAEAKERSRLEKEEKRKSKDNKGRFSGLLSRSGGAVVGATVGAGAAVAGATSALTSHPPAATSPSVDEPETVHDQVTQATPTTDPANEDTREINASPTEEAAAPAESRKSADVRPSTDSRRSLELSENETADSPNKRSSRVKSWMKTRFGSKSNTAKENEEMPRLSETADDTAAPTKTSEDKPGSDSMRNVAMAGRPSEAETEDMYGTDKPVSPIGEDHTAGSAKRSPSISSVSDSEAAVAPKARPSIEQTESETESRGRKGFRQRLLNKISSNKDKGKEKKGEKTLQPATTKSTTAADDEFEEARDTFEEEKLAPPPPLSSVTADGAGGSKGSPSGSRERSRFTEEL